MSPVYNFIRDVNPKKETWKLKVRVIRKYVVPAYNKPSDIERIDMVLMDEKSTKIHATVKTSLIRDFDHLLAEGKLYAVSNFGVARYGDRHKTCEHDYKINFYKTTSVRECDDVTIPQYGFQFVTFEDILANRLRPEVFIDLIGILTGVSPLESVGDDTEKKLRMKIQLEDVKKSQLTITLWGDYAEKMSSFVPNQVGRIVVALQFAKLAYYKGGFSISNSFYASRLLLNPEGDEFMDFLNSVSDVGPSSSAQLTQLSAGHSVSLEDEFNKLSERK